MMRKKVFVAMGGGVDSSVSAALLQKEGYDITGVFMAVWSFDAAQDKQPFFSKGVFECTQTDDRQEAMRAAAHLGIPFLTFDFEKEYKEAVVDYMVAEYKVGRTPNPDVMCNKHIKFGLFLKKALAMGADMIATGHYVRLGRTTIDNKQLTINKTNQTDGQMSNVKCQMFMGKDRAKDQSYFLWTLGQYELAHTLFPVGHLEKTEVRKLAKKFVLPNAERKESQGVCFLGEL